MPESGPMTSTADVAKLPGEAGGRSATQAVSPAVVFGIACVFYALAFVAPFTSMDAALFLLVAALFGQRLRPYLLLLVASVQDAPGLSYLWSYVCFAGIGGLLLINAVLDPPWGKQTQRFGPIERVVVMVIALVLYGVGIAWANDTLGGYPQSADRPFVAVAALTVVMVMSGYFSRHILDLDPANRRLLGVLAVLAIAHAIVIGILQIPFGQEVYRSGTNLAQVEATNQLMEAGVLGFARINGPFLSPNTFGYTILLFAVIAAVTLFETARWRVAFVYVIAGAGAVVLSMSKAVLGYYGLSGLVLSYFVIGGKRTFLLALAVLLAVPLILSNDLVQFAFEVFRVQEDTLGTRQLAWSAVVDNLGLVDWISGIGVGAWPPFFAQHIGWTLSDPHALLLSLPGSYGVLGVIFFVLLLATVFRAPIVGEDVTARRLGKGLLILVLAFKDLASIPAVLGNTPVTFLVWLVIGLVMASPKPASVRGSAV